MKYLIIKYRVCIVLLCMLSLGIAAQDTQTKGAVSLGGAWVSKAEKANFSVFGQTFSGVLTSENNVWSSTIGLIESVKQEIIANEPPIAIATEISVFIEGNKIYLEGYDPENQPLTFSIITNPEKVTLEATEIPGEYLWTPNAGLTQDIVLKDQLEFSVNDGENDSETVAFNFEFKIEDVAHEIVDFSVENEEVQLTIEDAFVNENYFIEIQYYDLTNPAEAKFKSLISNTYLASELTVDTPRVIMSEVISKDNHPYFFGGSKVFATVLVTTTNGNSSFDSYIIENDTSGRKITQYDDGLFFAVGSNVTVTENKEVELTFIGVELGNYNISSSLLEIESQPVKGTITIPQAQTSSDNFRKEWKTIYTATEDIGGEDLIQFKIFNQDRQAFVEAEIIITIIDVNDPPKLTVVGNQITNEDESIDVDLNIIDPDNDVQVTVTSSETSNLQASYNNGNISITPATNFFGRASITVLVEEVGTAEEFKLFDSFEVEVISQPDIPVVNQINDITINEDSSVNVTIVTTDPDVSFPIFDYLITLSDPSAANITTSSNIITITPNSNYSGNLEVSVTADDRLGTPYSLSTPEVFSLQVNPINDAPVIVQQFETQQIPAGFPEYKINLDDYFVDIDNQNLNYTIVGNTNINLEVADALLTINVLDSFSETETITITASDGEFSVSQNLVFVPIVQSPNIVVKNPINTQNLNEDFNPFTIDISNVFEDQNNANAIFTYQVSTSSNIAAEISNTNELTLKSSENYYGTETIFLIAFVDNESKFTSFDVTITQVNDSPVIAEITPITIAEDQTATSIFVGVTDIDTPLSDLNLVIASSNQYLIPTDGISKSLVSGGFTLEINPLENSFGTSTITVSINDGNLEQNTTFSVTVTPVNDAPKVVQETIANAIEDEPYSLDISSLFFDIDGDDLTYTLVEKPNWLSLNANLLIGTPSNDNVGIYNLKIRVDDSNDGIIANEYQLVVQNVNTAPYAVQAIPDLELIENFISYEIDLTNVFSDDDANEILNYTIISFDETSLDVTLTGSKIILKEVANGTSTIKILTNDEIGLTAEDEFKVTVFNVNDAPRVENEIEKQKYIIGFDTASISLKDVFQDEDGDVLTYTAESNDNQIVESKIQGNDIIITEKGDGTTKIEITANDGNGGIVTTTFEVEVTSTLGNDDFEITSRTIYPNPIKNYFYIKNIEREIRYKIYDITGKQIYSGIVKQDKPVYINNIANGIYLLKLEGVKRPLKLIINN